jgi:4-methylaminobutanoate oxidase (formaldehyde-forming)
MVKGEPVDLAYLQEGKWEVDIAGKIYPAEVSLKPMYDPAMEKVRA